MLALHHHQGSAKVVEPPQVDSNLIAASWELWLILLESVTGSQDCNYLPALGAVMEVKKILSPMPDT